MIVVEVTIMTVRSNKPHICCSCEQEIKQGELHVLTFVKNPKLNPTTLDDLIMNILSRRVCLDCT